MYQTRGDPFNAAVLMPQPLVTIVEPRCRRRTPLGPCRSGDTPSANMLVEFIAGGLRATVPTAPGAANPAPPQPRTRRRQA
jgi:hypothetical protein